MSFKTSLGVSLGDSIASVKENLGEPTLEDEDSCIKYCTSSFNDIVNTDNVRDLRRVVIRYRDYVSDPRAAHYIRENYADVLEALGLRIQFYIDGRVRLYLAN